MSAFERLLELVRAELGLELPEGRRDDLAEYSRRRTATSGRANLDAWIDALAAGALPGEWDLLANLLTIKESSFFRTAELWERLRTKLLPELAERRATARRLSAWSAASAGGEEPGSLALAFDAAPELAGWDWSILATDLDPQALAHTERGLYGARAIAAVPTEVRERRFTPHGELWELDPRLRSRIALRRLNLARPPWSLPESPFDLVFLRNVLIYFRPELQRRVVDEAIRHLAPDGWLVLGGSETLWRVHDGLEAVDLGGCFAYRVGRAGPSGEGRASRPAAVESENAPRRRGKGASTGRTPRGSERRRDEAPASPLPPTSVEQLVAAVRELEGGRSAAARTAVDRLLADDPAEPAAHALAGHLAELDGDAHAAVEAYRAALYLDPELATVRLLFADRLLALGESELARRQYRQVVATCERGAARAPAALAGRPLPEIGEALARARAALARA